MTGITGRTLLASTAMILTLSACEDGQGFGSSAGGSATTGVGAATVQTGARSETREVERPDVFSTNESGLWDGRPSLGGIWVAHPDVTTPERVRIENASNGRVIAGALFRRERNNPGPRIQISSDAADALGILAGQPTELNVVALRQEEVEIEPIIAPDTGDVIDGTAIAEADAEIVGATEAAMIDDSGAAMELDVAAPKPKRKGFFATLFGTGPSQKEPIETELVTEDGDVVTTTSAAAPGVDTETLDPIAAASAAIDEAEATSATAPAPARASSGGLKNPYVQVGLFSAEDNAEAAAASLRDAGIVPAIIPGSNGSRQYWRVLVGPMTNADDQAFMLKQVRDLGYSDAFLAPS